MFAREGKWCSPMDSYKKRTEEDSRLDELAREINVEPRGGFKTGDSTIIPRYKLKAQYSWEIPNPNRLERDGTFTDKQLKNLRRDFERFETFGPKNHRHYKKIISWLHKLEVIQLTQLAELEPRIRWLSHYAYNFLVSLREPVKSKIFGLDEKKIPVHKFKDDKVRWLNAYEDITYVVSKKTRKVIIGPVSQRVANKYVDNNGGGWKFTVIQRPQLDKKVGDKIGVLEQKQMERDMELTNINEKLNEARNDMLTMTFEFSNNKHAKAFAYDISNAGVATGDVVGKRVDVEAFDFESKTQKAISKYMKKHGGEFIEEDAPANSAGSGAVSGFTPDTIGVSKDDQKKHKKKKKVQRQPATEETKNYRTFMEGLEKNIRSWNSGNERIMVREKDGHPVFIVSVDEFTKCKSKRNKFERWSRFFDPKSTSGRKIKEYSHKNPSKPIVLQCSQTGELIYLRRRLNDSRLRHNSKKDGIAND